jgi:hypothetical protein
MSKVGRKTAWRELTFYAIKVRLLRFDGSVPKLFNDGPRVLESRGLFIH